VPENKAKLPLSKTHPELAKEAYGWDASSKTSGSDSNLEWQCKYGHIFKSTIANRSGKSKSGCPYCSGNKVLPGFNDLTTTHPEFALEADGWDPTKVSKGSEINRDWVCKFGHKWTVSPNSRTSKKKTGCPVCSNKKVQFGVNDLYTKNKAISSEAYGWDPKLVTQFSGKIVEWRCSEGHIWKARIYSRTKGKSGCPVCVNLKIEVGFNDLATTHPELAKEAFGWDPTKIVAGTAKKLEWKCNFNHVWKSPVYLRAQQNTGCPYCTNQKTLTGFNDLATTHPELAKQAFGWDPSVLTAGSIKRASWVCEFGHKWSTSVRNRGMRESGCPTCSGRITLVGFNDLATKFPHLAREAKGWNPKKYSPGSRAKKKWRCEFGHIWTAQIANRVYLERGCPSCSKTGFDPNKKSWLYFLEQEDWQMLQVGISNIPIKRLKEHESTGWKLLDSRGPMDGILTQQWETAILRMLKAKGADLSNSKIAGKFDGYSEAWSKSTFPVKSIKELMRLTEEFEEKKAL